MSSNGSQLQLVRSIVHGREQKLTAELSDLMRQRAGAMESVQRLQGYLHEYQCAEIASGARPVMEVQNERGFVKRLNLALEQQITQAQRLDESATAKMQLWQREHANLQALDRLLTQRELAQSRVRSRNEQKESDALSARAISNGVSR